MEHPPDDGRYRQSLVGVAARALRGEPFPIAVKELLDDIARRSHSRSTSAGRPGTSTRCSSHLGLAGAGEVLDAAQAVFGDRLDPAARFFVEQLFDG